MDNIISFISKNIKKAGPGKGKEVKNTLKITLLFQKEN